jgi:hypothetical protein
VSAAPPRTDAQRARRSSARDVDTATSVANDGDAADSSDGEALFSRTTLGVVRCVRDVLLADAMRSPPTRAVVRASMRALHGAALDDDVHDDVNAADQRASLDDRGDDDKELVELLLRRSTTDDGNLQLEVRMC